MPELNTTTEEIDHVANSYKRWINLSSNRLRQFLRKVVQILGEEILIC